MMENNEEVIQITNANSSKGADGINGLPENFKERSDKNLSLKKIAQIVYLCQALSFFFGITAIVGVILNYLKRDEAQGTWLESHFTWQTRIFWIGLMSSFIGFILVSILIGFLILAVTLVWTIYRVIKGYLLLDIEKPIENPSALI